MTKPTLCRDPGCDRPVKARGLCQKHYLHMRRATGADVGGASPRQSGLSETARARDLLANEKPDAYESDPARAALVRRLERLRDDLQARGASDVEMLQALRAEARAHRMQYAHAATPWLGYQGWSDEI